MFHLVSSSTEKKNKNPSGIFWGLPVILLMGKKLKSPNFFFPAYNYNSVTKKKNSTFILLFLAYNFVMNYKPGIVVFCKLQMISSWSSACRGPAKDHLAAFDC